jgi:hypothetical protein
MEISEGDVMAEADLQALTTGWLLDRAWRACSQGKIMVMCGADGEAVKIMPTWRGIRIAFTARRSLSSRRAPD